MLNQTRIIKNGKPRTLISTPEGLTHARDSGLAIAVTAGPLEYEWAQVFAAAPLMLELLRAIVPEHGDLGDLDYLEPEESAALDKARELLRELPNFSHYV